MDRLIAIIIFVVAGYLYFTATGHAQSAPTAGTQQTEQQQSGSELKTDRQKSLETQQQRSRSEATSNRSERQHQQTRSNDSERSRRAEQSNSTSTEVAADLSKMGISIMAEVERGQGSGLNATLIRKFPIITSPCLPRALILGSGGLFRGVDCHTVSGKAGDGAPDVYFVDPSKSGDTRDLMLRLVGSYLLRAKLLEAALQDLAEGGSVITVANSDIRGQLKKAIFQRLSDRSVAMAAWDESVKILDSSMCRVAAAHNVSTAVSFECGPFSVKNIFGPEASLAGQGLLGSPDIFGRTYAVRLTDSNSRSFASSASSRIGNSTSKTEARSFAATAENRQSKSASARKSVASSRSSSTSSSTQSQSGVNITPK